MVEPQISVVMPVYNVQNYIKQSIKSILNQSFPYFELLIINDGSEDDTLSLIKQIKDERIKIINNHHNFIDSLNKGVDASTGKYIARMDADDYMLPNRLERQYEFMEKRSDIDVCGTWAHTFGLESKKICTPVLHDDIVSSLILFNPLVHPSVVMRKTIFENTEFTIKYSCNFPYVEDYYLWMCLAKNGYKFETIPEILLFYRRSSTQITRVKEREMLRSTKIVQEEYMNHIIMNHKEISTLLNQSSNNDSTFLFSKNKRLYELYRSILKNGGVYNHS